jgi:hypothetical protein
MADNTLFAQHALENVRAEILQAPTVALQGRSIIPTYGQLINPAQTSHKFGWYSLRGSVGRRAPGSVDAPTSDASYQETTIEGVEYHTGYRYTYEEMRAAQFAGVPLDSLKALSARRQIEAFMDTVCATGDPSAKVLGALNQTAIPDDTEYSISVTAWVSRDGDDILADMEGWLDKIRSETKDVEGHSNMVIALPQTQYGYVMRRGVLPAVSTETIMDVFSRQEPGVSVVPWRALSTAGDGSSARAFIFTRDPGKLALVQSEEMNVHPEYQDTPVSWETLITCKTYGVVAFYPHSALYIDRI